MASPSKAQQHTATTQLWTLAMGCEGSLPLGNLAPICWSVYTHTDYRSIMVINKWMQSIHWQPLIAYPKLADLTVWSTNFSKGINGGFLKWWYPTTIGFPTKNDHFGVFWGYHHLRKLPNGHWDPGADVGPVACFEPSRGRIYFTYLVFWYQQNATNWVVAVLGLANVCNYYMYIYICVTKATVELAYVLNKNKGYYLFVQPI